MGGTAQVTNTALNTSLQDYVYLLAEVDPWDQVVECDESNNVVSLMLDDSTVYTQYLPNLFDDGRWMDGWVG